MVSAINSMRLIWANYIVVMGETYTCDNLTGKYGHYFTIGDRI